jgi:isocitrate dehydrogenase kinase/phosphatase
VDQGSTDSSLLGAGADPILAAFDTYQRRFRAITQKAQTRFENRDWLGMQADAAERIELYREVVGWIVHELRELCGVHIQDRALWARLRGNYSRLVEGRDDWEVAETFFNSITRRIFATVGVDPEIEFVNTLVQVPTRGEPPKPAWRTYSLLGPPSMVFKELLFDYAFRVDYEDPERDARLAAGELAAQLEALGWRGAGARLEMLPWVFYREQGAHLVGRVVVGERLIPLVLILLNAPRGLVLDAVLLDESEVSILFSFARSCFHVEIERTADLVHFLKSLMPHKPSGDLYIAIGYHKHGKTEIYRDLLRYLADSDDRFEVAPGEPGMVMIVFTLPAYHLVFKVIRDHFALPKTTTRQRVMAKYDLVFKHDRAGRLVDAQEFEHLKFKCSRFAPELLDQLRIAAHGVKIQGDHVVLPHLYVERRVTPLNLYLEGASGAAADLAVTDYGNAIKDLAYTNIFPGDLLLKNFGVTRHGRVVFYDYDEISLLTACDFRTLPRSRTDEEELSPEPWFAVGEHDVFPEELASFLPLQGRLRDAFLSHHSQLFTLTFWQDVKMRISAGEVFHIFPYGQHRRLSQHGST